MEDNGKLGWFFAGAIIGAGVALLYAPKTGKDTRKYLGETSKEGQKAMEASGKELMERGKKLVQG